MFIFFASSPLSCTILFSILIENRDERDSDLNSYQVGCVVLVGAVGVRLFGAIGFPLFASLANKHQTDISNEVCSLHLLSDSLLLCLSG